MRTRPSPPHLSIFGLYSSICRFVAGVTTHPFTFRAVLLIASFCYSGLHPCLLRSVARSSFYPTYLHLNYYPAYALPYDLNAGHLKWIPPLGFPRDLFLIHRPYHARLLFALWARHPTLSLYIAVCDFLIPPREPEPVRSRHRCPLLVQCPIYEFSQLT